LKLRAVIGFQADYRAIKRIATTGRRLISVSMGYKTSTFAARQAERTFFVQGRQRQFLAPG